MKSRYSIPRLFQDADLTLIDVGARGGLPLQWQPFNHLITSVLVEPDPAEASCLAENLKSQGLKGVKVIEKALGRSKGTVQLNLLQNPECSSILEPNYQWLARFPDADRFRAVKKVPIELSTLDHELSTIGIERCDFLKLDVQGFEMEVLAGAQQTLRQCLAIELEVSFNQIYRHQPLFAEIDSTLRPLGFGLVDLERIWWRRTDVPNKISSRGHIIWANVLYTKDPWVSGDLSREKLINLAIILSSYRLFDMVHELFRMGVQKGSIRENELKEVDEWMAKMSFVRNPWWRLVGRLPHFPYKRRLARFAGMLARCLQQDQYGEGVGVDAVAFDRKWDWF